MAENQMPAARQSAGSSVVEILDHVLDKGIVIDAWVAVSVIGIELVTIDARIIVASIDSYVKYARILGEVGPIAGGLRQPTKRKSLGEGLRDAQEGLGNLPLIGKQKEQVTQSQPSSRSTGRKNSRTKKAGNKKR